jgi:hypothetical protein
MLACPPFTAHCVHRRRFISPHGPNILVDLQYGTWIKLISIELPKVRYALCSIKLGILSTSAGNPEPDPQVPHLGLPDPDTLVRCTDLDPAQDPSLVS